MLEHLAKLVNRFCNTTLLYAALTARRAGLGGWA